MMASVKKPRRRSTLGTIIPSKNHFRARYARNGQWHTPGHTFLTFALADQWLAGEQQLIDRDEWSPPAQRRATETAAATRDALTFGDYSERWIQDRQVRGRPLKERTAADYRIIRRRALAPWLDVPLVDISRPSVLSWYQGMNPDAPVARQHAYALFRSILASALDDGIVTTNPVHIRGAGSRDHSPTVELFTTGQISELTALMEPRLRAAILLAAWCGLRFGEIAALRRSDVELTDTGGFIHIRRGVVLVDGQQIITSPKSDAGERRVAVPPHIVPALREHLQRHAQWGPDGLVVPSSAPSREYLTPGQLYGAAPTYAPDGAVKKQGRGFYRARHLMGREDLSFHKLRHFAATTYAVAGATQKELMVVMGHSDPNVSMRYQHAAASRVTELAARMSALAALTEEA